MEELDQINTAENKKEYDRISEEIESLHVEHDKIITEGLFNKDPYYDNRINFNRIKNEILELKSKRRLVQPVEFYGFIDEEDDVMSLSDFIASVKAGIFGDDDGHGRYVLGNRITNITIHPSDVIDNTLRNEFKLITWFSK